MARGFRSAPAGIIGRFSAQERGLLGRLFQDIITLLDDEQAPPDASADPLEAAFGSGAEVEAPTDPALRRLLPDASRDPEQAGEFRRFTDQSLREQKIAALRQAALAVEQDAFVLDRAAAVEFSRALNDVRLVLSTRLGIETEADARRIEKRSRRRAQDAEAYMGVVYSFISWAQDSLVEAMLLDLPDPSADPQSPADGQR